MTVWIMEATKESSSSDKALSSLFDQVSIGILKTESISATEVQPRVNGKKFTNHFLCGVFPPFTHKPTGVLLVCAPGCPQSRWVLPSAGRRKSQHVTWSPPQDDASQEWLPTSLGWAGNLLSNGLMKEGPEWPQAVWLLRDWFLDNRFNRGSHEEKRQSGSCEGFLFRKNALWNSNTGYALTFGKGTSLLVTPGEFFWLTNYLFWKEMGPVET